MIFNEGKIWWLYELSEWEINVTAISWREQVNFEWDDDDTRFVPDQHA